ncbi:membrane protein [Iodidimonas muriae]|uniref:Membrane protein n=1 Tax=Iodidimonas muriae TaxID=261467 RepID=A0ABQ2LFU2_9PROT|nr:outer membrane protein assembly factor BamE [Iodidimonas muriae]GER08334.1 membrane protein [Kordiimonadales bacterium JCM 17843]GGO16246.1 membrane protein [Iodidimonas muriae]
MSIFRNMAATIIVGSLLSACTTAVQTRGYVVDEELAEAISPGVDNRNSVQEMMGSPSITSAFGEEIWYYISRDTVTRGFIEERPLSQLVIEVQFDDGGTVADVRRYDLADSQEIDPRNAITPIRGKTLGFFEQLLRGIGRVGPAGPGGGGPPGT